MQFNKLAALAVICGLAASPVAAEDITLPLVTAIPPSAGYEGRTHDILGLSFGMPYDEAIQALRAAMPGAEVVENAVVPGLGDSRGNQIFFRHRQHAYAVSTGSPAERIDLRFATDATGGGLYQIRRTVDYPQDQLTSMADLKASIEAKYGEATLIELFPHQNRDHITYTFEKRPVQTLPVLNMETDGFKRHPSFDNPCLSVAESSGYLSTSGYEEYSFMQPGRRRGHDGWDVCSGAIQFVIVYGRNAETVRQINVLATDYDRSMQDALVVDELLPALLSDKANAATGTGAPRL